MWLSFANNDTVMNFQQSLDNTTSFIEALWKKKKYKYVLYLTKTLHYVCLLTLVVDAPGSFQ